MSYLPNQIKSADDITEDMVGRPALFVHKASGMEEWEILERGFIGSFEYAAKHHYIYLAPTLEELQNQAAVMADCKEALKLIAEAPVNHAPTFRRIATEALSATEPTK